MPSPNIIRDLIDRPPAWVLAGAAIDLDFQRGRYFQQGVGDNVGQLLTCSRASTGYVDYSNGIWRPTGSNILRVSDKGLLVEEARTNSIRNNSMQGAVVGTPGTKPTNWGTGNLQGLTVNVIALGTEAGIDYIDFQWTGTPSGTGLSNITFEATGQIAASQNQSWTASAFVKLQAGSLTNVSTVALTLQEKNGAGSTLTSSAVSFSPATTTLGVDRQSVTYTLPSATAASVLSVLGPAVTSGQAVDVTLRIGWPQLELGAFVTSPIRTTNAAVTRAADVVTASKSPAFGAAYTLFANVNPIAPTTYNTNQLILSIDQSIDNNQRFQIKRNATTGAAVATWFQTDITDTTILTTGVPNKLAASGVIGSQSLSTNGNAIVTGSVSDTVSALNTVHIGCRFDGALRANAYISRIAIWPAARLSNATLRALTQ